MKRLLALALLVPVAACSAATEVAPSSSANATVASSSKPTPSSTPPSSTPTATALTTTDLAIGQTASLSKVELTVLKLKSVPKIGSMGPWQLFLVKACIRTTQTQSLPVSYMLWRAEDADGSRYHIGDIAGDSRFEPKYPSGNDPQDVVQPGKCLQGWMPVETTAKLTSLTYANDQGERASWRVS